MVRWCLLMLLFLFGSQSFGQASKLFKAPIFRKAQLDIRENIPYGTGEFSYFSYYAPREEFNYVRPLMIIVPGSGFQVLRNNSGEIIKLTEVEEAKRKAEFFARCGYAVALLDYHRYEKDLCEVLSKDNVWYPGAQSVYAAYKFLSYHAPRFNISTEHVFFSVESAGGIASLPVIFNSPGNLELYVTPDVMLTQGKLDALTFEYVKQSESRIRGVLSEAAAFPKLELLSFADQNSDVPLIAFHSRDDQTVYYETGFKECVGLLYGSNWVFDVHMRECMVMVSFNSASHNVDDLVPHYTMEASAMALFYKSVTEGFCERISVEYDGDNSVVRTEDNHWMSFMNEIYPDESYWVPYEFTDEGLMEVPFQVDSVDLIDPWIGIDGGFYDPTDYLLNGLRFEPDFSFYGIIMPNELESHITVDDGRLYLSLIPSEDLYDMTLVNAEGKVVMKKKVSSHEAVSLENLNSGIYIARIHNTLLNFSEKLFVE